MRTALRSYFSIWNRTGGLILITVPVAICGEHITPDDVQVYSETAAPKGSLGFMNGEQFMRKVMNL